MADVRKLVEIIISAVDKTGPGTKAASGNIATLASAGTKVGVGMATAGAAVVGALAGMAIASARTADELRDLSIQTGVGVEDLSVYKFAAGQTGTTLEAVTTSIRFLNRNQVEAAQGNKAVADTFRRLGIDVKDSNGSLKASNVLYLETADAISRLPTQAERTAAAMDLMGRNSNQLTEFLALGKEGLSDMRVEAERLGVVFEEKDAVAADKFNDEVKKSREAVAGLGNQIGRALLPALTDLATDLTGAVVKLKEFAEAHPDLTKTALELGGVAVAGGVALNVFAGLATIMSGLKDSPAVFGAIAKAIAGIGIVASTATALVAGLVATLALIAVEHKKTQEGTKGGLTEAKRRENFVRADPELKSLAAERRELIDLYGPNPAIGSAGSLEILSVQRKSDERVEALRKRFDQFEASGGDSPSNPATRPQATAGLTTGQTPPPAVALTLEEQLKGLKEALEQLTLPEEIRVTRVLLAEKRLREGVGTDEDRAFLRRDAEQSAAERLEDVAAGRKSIVPGPVSLRPNLRPEDRADRRLARAGETPDAGAIEPVPVAAFEAEQFEETERQFGTTAATIEKLTGSFTGLQVAGVDTFGALGEAAGGEFFYALLQGENSVKALGQAVKQFAIDAVASFAAAAAKALFFNAALALFTGGPFSPFKGLFGAEGGKVETFPVPNLRHLAEGGRIGSPSVQTAASASAGAVQRFADGGRVSFAGGDGAALSAFAGPALRVPVQHFADGGAVQALASLPHFAGGGAVSGGVPGRDSVLGVLMPGEVVLSNPQVDYLSKLTSGTAGQSGPSGAKGSAAKTAPVIHNHQHNYQLHSTTATRGELYELARMITDLQNEVAGRLPR